MNRGTMILLVIAIFFCLAFTTPPTKAQAASPKLATDRPIYPIWGIGGTIAATASQLVTNASYYVWLQRPTDLFSIGTGIHFAGTSVGITFQINVAGDDPPGTYIISLSTSNSQDNKQAVAHFGVFGTDAKSYQRTQQVVIAGGGFAPNSTVHLNATIAGRTVPESPFNIQASPKGEFRYTFRPSPSLNVGLLTFIAIGTTFDTGQIATSSVADTLTTSPVSVKPFAQPPTPTQRTAQVSVSYQLKYVDGSPVTTSAVNSTRGRVIADLDGSVLANVSMALSDPTQGVWTMSWVPPFSLNLGLYHFEIPSFDFNDSYGNLGNGTRLVSQSFRVIPASTSIQFQTNSTVQRKQQAVVVISAKYHDGSSFANVTQTAGNLTGPGTRPQALVLNKTLDAFTTHFEVRENATLGAWTVNATVRDLYGNAASGKLLIQVVKAMLGFDASYPASPERTTILNVTARVIYPDGSTVSASNIPTGFNLTISIGNFTWRHPMSYDQTTGAWSSGYVLSQNATLGDYAISMNVNDTYGNSGQFVATSRVIPATLRFMVPIASARTESQTPVNIKIFVRYPNGSSLTPSVAGHVTASITNSSGTFGFPMDFNATDQSWVLPYTPPNIGLSFAKTITFSFNARDAFGNAGLAPDAYSLAVGAAVQTLILSAIVASVVPIALSAWAILTVTGKRRKHKP